MGKTGLWHSLLQRAAPWVASSLQCAQGTISQGLQAWVGTRSAPSPAEVAPSLLEMEAGVSPAPALQLSLLGRVPAVPVQAQVLG